MPVFHDTFPWRPSLPSQRLMSPSLYTPDNEVKITQSCLTLCDFMDCTVHGILQARILEWVAFLFCRRSAGVLPYPGIKPRFPTLQADSLSAEPQGKP